MLGLMSFEIFFMKVQALFDFLVGNEQQQRPSDSYRNLRLCLIRALGSFKNPLFFLDTIEAMEPFFELINDFKI